MINPGVSSDLSEERLSLHHINEESMQQQAGQSIEVLY